MIAAQQGDPRAIATLVSGSHPHVQRFARTLCAMPEDAAQEALLLLYRKVGTVRVAAALASWMFQVVRNERIRRTRLALRAPTPPVGVEPSAEHVLLARLEIERIVGALAALPAEQRAVLVPRDIQGMSGAASAQALGLSRAAMRSRLHPGREAPHSRLAMQDATADEALHIH